MSWDSLEAAGWLAAASSGADGGGNNGGSRDKAVLMQAGTGDSEASSRRENFLVIQKRRLIKERERRNYLDISNYPSTSIRPSQIVHYSDTVCRDFSASSPLSHESSSSLFSYIYGLCVLQRDCQA